MKCLYSLLPILFLIYWGCENPLESRVEDLENQLAQQQTEQEQQQALIDSLITVVSNQQTSMDSLNATQQAYIDSLINAGDVADSLLQIYIDSLNTVQNAYIDSLHNAQQTTLEALANSALSAGFVETEVFSGTIPSSWTDVDLSSAVGQFQSLVILKYHINENNVAAYISIRPNGSNDEYGGTASKYNSLNYIFLTNDHENSLTLVNTDSAGKIEHKDIMGNSYNIQVSVVFYLNQNDTINP